MPRFKKNNRLFVPILASLLCLISSAPLLAGDNFAPFTATYTVSRNNSEIGVRTHALSRQDDRYIYEAKMHTTGLASILKPGKITERSQWQFKNKKVLPISYEYDDSSDEKRHTLLDFDWPNNSVTNHVGSKPWAMNIPNGTQDKFSYMLALMHDLQQGTQNPQYKIADGGRLKTYQFKALGTEVIEIPAGKFKTLKLQRIRIGKKNRITYLWCLPEKHYLPIKIERHKGDNIYSMELNELK